MNQPVRLEGPTSSSALLISLAVLAVGCGTPPPRADDDVNYLRYVTVEAPGHERVLLRWQDHQMPLRIHLARPPRGLFADPEAVLDSVRDGITDWSDVVEPGLPSFRFVDDPGRADIPITWDEKPPDPRWYVAHCSYDIQVFSRRWGVSHILVTARWWDGREASLADLYNAVLHEMGHALGLAGHSPDPQDVMYPDVASGITGLSERDRQTLIGLYRSPNGRRIGNAVAVD